MEAVSDIIKYGCAWPEGTEPLKIEIACIQSGGKWKMGNRECGMGLFFHYQKMRELIWPELDSHRWHNLCLDTIVNNKVTVLMGCGSCGKTHEAASFGCCYYWVDPEKTCVLASSTDIRGLRQRVWGEIATLWQKGVDRFPWLAGHLLDSRIAITTDELEDGDFEGRRVRDMRRGIFGVPCVQGGTFVGMQKYIGIKSPRLLLLGDELSAMSSSFLSAFSNLNKNPEFRAVLMGNPMDPLDALGKASEPLDGWTAHLEPEKTSTWKNRFMDGITINLIGPDSPNFDFDQTKPPRYPYLISKRHIDETLRSFSKDSFEYYSQCIGSMKIGTLARRVLTQEMCRKYGATEQVRWTGKPITKVAALDAAYGGDRAVLGHIEFGEDVSGKIVINFNPPVIVPFNARSEKLPEEQLAEYCKEYCERNDIPASHFFHDSTGRGSLGTFLARVWSADTNPVEFGGKPTERPVSLDIFVYDPKTRVKRLKKCSEHFVKFVTELWFSLRYAIEAGQVRNLPEQVIDEGCMREYERVKDDKIELESKVLMKERVGRSPDFCDFASIAVEGARRLGFQISKLSNEAEGAGNWNSMFREAQLKASALWRNSELVSV